MTTQDYQVRYEDCMRRFEATKNSFWYACAQTWLKMANTAQTCGLRASQKDMN